MRDEWLAVLVCPATRTPLRWDGERQELVSDAARLAYPVRDGMPVMLIEEARPLPFLRSSAP
ncbi:MAG TPA: Trm112 family protein [Allosphingosinicella sp.]|nr:Trm112 family protein [Allosphingosinicella sp.]